MGGVSHNAWANGWGISPTADPLTFTTSGSGPSLALSTPCPGCVGNLGRNSFVGPGQWFADMTLSKTFKITERVNLKFDANAFNVFNHTNFILATAGGGANNKYASIGLDPITGLFDLQTISNFGQAAGTLRAREMQFGVKFSF